MTLDSHFAGLSSRQPFGRRKICATSRLTRPGTRYHGVHPVRTLRRALPAGQLRVRSVGRRKQLGQGPLHGGRRTRGRRVGRGAQRERELRLSAGIYKTVLKIYFNYRYTYYIPINIDYCLVQNPLEYHPLYFA